MFNSCVHVRKLCKYVMIAMGFINVWKQVEVIIPTYVITERTVFIFASDKWLWF